MDEVVAEAEAAPEVPAEGTEVVDVPEVVDTSVVDAGPDWGARVSEWGGEDRISDALAIAEALTTKEGVEALVREGLTYMDMDPEKAFALARGEELPDPDALMTRAEFEAELGKRDQSWQEKQYAAQEAVATQAVEAKIADLGIENPQERSIVLTFAQQYVPVEEMNPARLADAIEKGYADYISTLERQAETRLRARAAKNDTTPTPLRGGGQPAGTVVDKPEGSTNMDDWKAAARKFMETQASQNP